MLLHHVELSRATVREAFIVPEIEDQVVPDGERTDQPVFGPILRDVTEASPQDLLATGASDVASRDRHASTGDREQPRDGLDECGLTVALDAGDRHDLPTSDTERDVLDEPCAVGGDDIETLDSKCDLAGCRNTSVDRQDDRTSDHHVGKILRFRGPGVDRPDRTSPSEHRDPIGDLPMLPELVRDEDDGAP